MLIRIDARQTKATEVCGCVRVLHEGGHRVMGPLITLLRSNRIESSRTMVPYKYDTRHIVIEYVCTSTMFLLTRFVCVCRS